MTDQRAAIGIDVGGTKTAVGLVDVSSGEVLEVREIETQADEGAEQLHQRLRPLVAEIVGLGRAAPLGVGIAVPEVVSPNGSVLTDVVVAGLRGHLADAWADLGVTRVLADVRAAATAEARFGQGSSFGSFGYVSVGTGISYCFVLDGKPWAGANGAAILLGSGILVDRGSFDGREGRPNLEEFASGSAIAEHYRAASGEAVSAREVLDRCQVEATAAEVVTAAGTALGLGLAALVNLLDPSAVVVGGGLGSVDGLYWDSAVAAARAAIWAEVSRDVPILHAALGPSAGVVGAAVGSTPAE